MSICLGIGFSSMLLLSCFRREARVWIAIRFGHWASVLENNAVNEIDAENLFSNFYINLFIGLFYDSFTLKVIKK